MPSRHNFSSKPEGGRPGSSKTKWIDLVEGEVESIWTFKILIIFLLLTIQLFLPSKIYLLQTGICIKLLVYEVTDGHYFHYIYYILLK